MCIFHENEKILGLSSAKDMQSAPPPPFSFDPVFINDAQCAQTNEKSILRSDFYFLSCRENSSKIGVNWVQKFTKYDQNSENRILKFDFFSSN